MATGIPKTNWRGSSTGATPKGSPGGEIQLTYVGKKPEAEILRTTPASLHAAWSSEAGEPTNRLYYGENLAVLAALLRDPAIRGQVRLAYIDPPYATRSVFQSRKQDDAYSDLLEGAAYLEFQIGRASCRERV